MVCFTASGRTMVIVAPVFTRITHVTSIFPSKYRSCSAKILSVTIFFMLWEYGAIFLLLLRRYLILTPTCPTSHSFNNEYMLHFSEYWSSFESLYFSTRIERLMREILKRSISKRINTHTDFMKCSWVGHVARQENTRCTKHSTVET